MSIFNLNIQNENIGNKIAAGLERLSHIFKALLWEKAKEYGLSPIQIQILLFIQYHSDEKNTVSYLAKEFSVTKPTISDAVKALEQKKLVNKFSDAGDSRSYSLRPTDEAKKIIAQAETFANPITQVISGISEADKDIIWNNISGLITKLNRQGIITVQRSCCNCIHLDQENDHYFCQLLRQPLHTSDLRIDCPEFTEAS